MSKILYEDMPEVTAIFKRLLKVYEKKRALSGITPFSIHGSDESDEEKKEEEVDHDKIEVDTKDSSSVTEEVDPTLGQVAFPTISEPKTEAVGHYMFLRCGHNGTFLQNERKVLIKHLQNAGILPDSALLRPSILSE